MSMLLNQEHSRLSTDLAQIEERLSRTQRGFGLRSRSVHSFLSQLRRHKSELLNSVDQKIADRAPLS